MNKDELDESESFFFKFRTFKINVIIKINILLEFFR